MAVGYSEIHGSKKVDTSLVIQSRHPVIVVNSHISSHKFPPVTNCPLGATVKSKVSQYQLTPGHLQNYTYFFSAPGHIMSSFTRFFPPLGPATSHRNDFLEVAYRPEVPIPKSASFKESMEGCLGCSLLASRFQMQVLKNWPMLLCKE